MRRVGSMHNNPLIKSRPVSDNDNSPVNEVWMRCEWGEGDEGEEGEEGGEGDGRHALVYLFVQIFMYNFYLQVLVLITN